MKLLTKKQKALLESVKTHKEIKGKSKLTAGLEYIAEITHGKKFIFMAFHDNIHNKADKSDFLFALLSDANAYKYARNLGDFMAEFGYEDEEQAKEIFDACKIQYKKLKYLFTEKQIEQLEAIFEDY